MGGRVGLAFSSPPYFDAEDYIIGDQSYKPGISYKKWLDEYMTPTIQNIHYYLIDDGVFCINVKNTAKYTLENDVNEIAKSVGFELFSVEGLQNNRRPNPQIKVVDNSEKIFCFKKSN